jgi:D-2-hydroxyacid dehydrogenase (NADP+)
MLMGLILCQDELRESEIKSLISEFPSFKVVSLDPGMDLSASRYLEKMEIYYGSTLSKNELEKAYQLHWIHSPSSFLHDLCIDDIFEKESIVLTNTKGKDISQIGEFIITGTTAFAKNLFTWKREPMDSLSQSMWELNKKIFIQIGVGHVGSEICKRAQFLGMKVWGVRKKRSFHPYCDKIFNPSQLNSILPAADIISLALPRGAKYKNFISANELRLMKDDAILAVVGTPGVIDENALIQLAREGKFKGVLVDATAEGSPLRQLKKNELPQLLLTPSVAECPRSTKDLSYQIFRENLRKYIYGNFTEMKNRIHALMS